MYRREDKMPILEVLEQLQAFNPIKICFNGFELYNDYNSNVERLPGVFGEIQPYDVVVPERLKSALENYDVWVTKLEISIVQHHHSLVFMYGEKIKKGYFDEEV